MEKQAALDLLEFIHESPTNFHAVLSINNAFRLMVSNSFFQEKPGISNTGVNIS